MPLDLEIVREHVRWPRGAGSALREGVESLEDHLIGVGYDDLLLRIEVRARSAGLAEVTAELRLPIQPIVRQAEDLDLPLLLVRVLEEVRKEATLERLIEGGARTRPSGSADPWTALRDDLYAIAHRELTHAVELGDLPPGWVDAADLTDEVLLQVLDGGAGPVSRRVLASNVRQRIARRIRGYQDRADDFSLDERLPDPDPSASALQDEIYDFRVADEVPLRGEDVLGVVWAPEDKIAAEEPTEFS